MTNGTPGTDRPERRGHAPQKRSARQNGAVSKRVPALEKAMKVVRLVAFNPEETFTLSRIAEETGTSPSTCHALVMALCAEGLLLRHERTKSYSLGTAALELGTLASAQFPGLPLARDLLYPLARHLDCSAMIGARADDELLIVGHYENEHLTPLGRDRTGFRGPMVPPLGLLFVAWAGPDEIDTWLERRSASPEEERSLRDELERVRAQGYWLTRNGDAHDLVQQLARALTDELDPEKRVRIATELAGLVSRGALAPKPSGTPRLDVIAAPVADADGAVTLTLCLATNAGALSAAAAEDIAGQLLDACAEVTVALGGSPLTPRRRRNGRAKQAARRSA